MVNAINNSYEFRNTINNIVNSDEDDKFYIKFTSTNLLLAIHAADLYITGEIKTDSKNKKTGLLHIKITDVYDFKEEDYSLDIKDIMVTFVNNRANTMQGGRIINNYTVDIYFIYNYRED